MPDRDRPPPLLPEDLEALTALRRTAARKLGRYRKRPPGGMGRAGLLLSVLIDLEDISDALHLASVQSPKFQMALEEAEHAGQDESRRLAASSRALALLDSLLRECGA